MESLTWENTDIASLDTYIKSTMATSSYKLILRIYIGDMTFVENLVWLDSLAGLFTPSDGNVARKMNCACLR
jgi:hypothetical protein